MAVRSCLLAIVVLVVVTNSAIIPASIASPCPAGKTAYANSVPVTSNGCGSGATQAALASALVPYLNDFTPCCNAHDICFGTCAISNFLAAFNTCNSSFKTCMYSKCAAKARAIWNPITAYLTKSACETTASLLYDAVNSLGKGIYVSSQKLHCSCK
jgi:hypothetical protein